jgi:hypothetical protein
MRLIRKGIPSSSSWYTKPVKRKRGSMAAVAPDVVVRAASPPVRNSLQERLQQHN